MSEGIDTVLCSSLYLYPGLAEFSEVSRRFDVNIYLDIKGVQLCSESLFMTTVLRSGSLVKVVLLRFVI